MHNTNSPTREQVIEYLRQHPEELDSIVRAVHRPTQRAMFSYADAGHGRIVVRASKSGRPGPVPGSSETAI